LRQLGIVDPANGAVRIEDVHPALVTRMLAVRVGEAVDVLVGGEWANGTAGLELDGRPGEGKSVLIQLVRAAVLTGHFGEAQASRTAFEALSADEQAKVVEFLLSL